MASDLSPNPPGTSADLVASEVEGGLVPQFDLDEPGPWGPGGFEVTVTADDEPAMLDFLLSLKTSITKPTAKRITHRACRIGHFAAEGGPKDAAAEGKAFNLNANAAHGIYDPERSKWSVKVLRHQLAVGVLERGVDAIVICGFEVAYPSSAGYLVSALAFNRRGRAIISVGRAILEQGDGKKVERRNGDRIKSAYAQVVEEVSHVLRIVGVGSVPILVESPIAGRNVIQPVVRSGLDYLVELPTAWSEGGLLPAERLGDADSFFNGGTTIRGVFNSSPDGTKTLVEARLVALEDWGHDLENWAARVRSNGSERFFLGRTSNHRDYSSTEAGVTLARETQHWSGTHLAAGAYRNYGFERFRAQEGAAFQRHFTIMALRDAFAFERDLA